jgi:hypothetical protein
MVSTVLFRTHESAYAYANAEAVSLGLRGSSDKQFKLTDCGNDYHYGIGFDKDNKLITLAVSKARVWE